MHRSPASAPTAARCRSSNELGSHPRWWRRRRHAGGGTPGALHPSSAGGVGDALVGSGDGRARLATGSTSTAAPAIAALTAEAPPRITPRVWALLAVVSGLLPAYVLHQVGWSVIAFPPLLLLVGLVQLAYCDLTRRLLPKTLVYALSAAVIVSGVVIAGVMHEWQRLLVASIGGSPSSGSSSSSTW